MFAAFVPFVYSLNHRFYRINPDLTLGFVLHRRHF